MIAMNYEQITLEIIVNGGNARSYSMEAIHLAKAGKLEEAREKLEAAGKVLGEAHAVQTRLIQEEASGNTVEMSLLMVHAQDHLMNAITVKDLAEEFIDMYERIYKRKTE
jgi:PTS system cellobiose-specific IIA component